MKSKITKIQILKKGIALALSAMFLVTPITYATTSLDDSYLESSILDKLLYGTIGSTVKEIEEYFNSGETTLYIINETQLRAFAEYVNNGNSCRGKEIILLNDIELDEDKEWVPIGNETIAFRGIFNGNTYTIYNVTLNEKSNNGLFGYVVKGTIKNLNVSNINIEASRNIVENVGGIVGYIEDGNVLNCVTNGTINGQSYTGGIVGKAVESTIKNCINKTNIKSNASNIGGIVGEATGTIESCVNEGIVETYSNDNTENNGIGGIAGTFSGTITNCINKSKISGYSEVAGIVGQTTNEGSNIIVNKCENTGRIIAYSSAAGILSTGYHNVTIENSKNSGEIEGEESYYYNTCAGIFSLIPGRIEGKVVVRNCLNNGKIIAGGMTDGAAIIADLTKDDKVENCINEYRGVEIYATGGLGSVKYCINYINESNVAPELLNTAPYSNSYKIARDITKAECNTIKENIDNFDEIYKFDQAEGKIVFKNTTGAIVSGVMQTIDSDKNLIASYDILEGYYNAGDTIEVNVTFNKKLYTSLGTNNTLLNKDSAPKLTMKINKVAIELDINNVTISGNTTIVNYSKEITEDMANGKVTELKLNTSKTYYAIEGSVPTDTTTYPNYKVSSIDKTLNMTSYNIVVDTIKPIITTKVYVENMLETERYTAGKEIIFEVKTSEIIQGLYEVPQIQVSFSESGIGKYNYLEEEGKSGFVKCKDAVINSDGTTTWTFSYQVQERDEGELEFTFVDGEIVDLAGNETNIKELYKPSTTVTSDKITENEWGKDLGVTFEFYKNSVSEANKVTSQTYFTGDDNLVVAATFDKVLYVHYGLSDGKNTNIRLNNTYKDRAPSLYLNADSALKQSSIYSISTTKYVEDTSTSGKTRVLYVFSKIAKNYGLKQLTQVESVVLKNENNEEAVSYNNTTVSTNGLIPYAEKYYETYKDEEEDLYNKTLTSGKTKTISGLDDILIDPVGVSDKIEKSDIYADTTAPTVEIIADKANPTNADLIKYTFKFSEVVEGFTAEDVTVNNGVKATKEVTIDGEVINQPKFVEVVDGLEYTLEVKPTIVAGNEGIVQVIVEEGAVKDLVAINNVRQESNITIDKVIPTVEITADKGYVKADETITYTFTWSEEIKEFTKENINVVNGEIVEGSLNKVNELQYTIQVNPTNGNDVEVSVLKDSCEDLAGNKNIEAKHIIIVIPTVTITTNTTNPTNENEIEYTFTWSEEVKGFEDKDVILPEGVEGTFEKVSDTVYKMKVDYNPIIPSGNEGEVTIAVVEKAVKDLNGNENAYTTNTLKIDRIAPIFIGLEAYATSDIKLNSEIDVVKEYYKAGETITVVATFTENIEKSTSIPALALQFSESGNAKGTINSTKSGNTIVYTYEIKDGDMGTLSVKGFSGVVTDNAGNEIKVTKRTLDGDTIIVDTNAPSLKELNVTTAEGIYKAGTTIEIEAIYDEEIYGLVNNEIKNISQDNAPILKLRLGNGAEKTATVRGYGETDGKEDKTKIRYTYTIVDGDNGLLAITSYDNKENIKVCDIAGNESSLGVNQTGNAITADTIRPEVTNITAEVENPTISNTGIYHKAGNEIKITVNFTEEVSAAKLWSRILIGFSEDENAEPTEYKEVLDLNATSQIREFSYTIQDGDNGYLWVKVEEGHFKDEAGNINIAEEATKIETVFADTTKPTLTIYKDTETTQNGQRLTVNATFSENLYGLSDNSRKTLETKDAPIIIYGFAGATGNLEEKAYSVGENVITYVITKENTVSGEFYHAYFRGNVYDRAGNECFTNDNLDTIAPVLESVVISSNSGIYSPYCKEGREIYVTATFDEPIKAENMKLKVKVGEVEITELLDGNIVEENKKQVKFTYTVKPGDMGEFKILDICGETDNEITEENADKTYGWVEDQHGNRNKIYNLSDEGVTATGKAEADTKNPYITSIKAIANGKEIATYTKEEGKDAVITVGRTNANIVEYIVTYSEKVPYSHFDKIRVINGEIKDIQYTNFELNEYKITVQITKEGVQSLIINEGTVEDKAGNIDAFVRLDVVTVDFTKPTVRFISEYNGGVYVLPTNIDKVEIRPNVEISEEIAKIEYKWDNEEYAEIENYSTSSDIAIPTKAFAEYGQYKLFIKVEDLAGNIYETSKTYIVKNASIDIDLSTYEYTNQDIKVTVSFDEELTDNRKVTFKAEGSEETIELNATGTNENGTEYVIGTNGTIYAEATDRIGNKVFTEEKITKIDKEKPVVDIEVNGANLIIGTGKENATIKTNVKVEDNNYGVETKFAYIQEDIDVYNITSEQKAKISNNLEYEAKIQNAVSTKDNGPYYLYVIATDIAGNETIVKSSAFTVLNTNATGEEGSIPAEIEMSKLISFKQEGKYINISYNNFGEDYLNIIREKEISLTNERDGYIDYEYGSYVEVNGATTITVVGTDACGNKVTTTYEVTRDSIEGPEFDVIGNPKEWTNQDVKLEVSCYERLSALTVNGTDILSKDEDVRSYIVISQNGDYEFVATDTYGNISKKIIKVSKIDKVVPEISKVENKGKDITITATDSLSGVKEYAITKTTEVPVEWSKSNIIKVTEDGIFYAWAKDNAGNISRAENVIIVDTTAPTVTFNYLSQTVTVGMPLETSIITNENATISYSWDNENWITSEEKLTSLKVSEKSTTIGKSTLYVKATDEAGNESKVQTLEFNVVNVEEIRQPEIVFEDIPTVQVNGVKYVKISTDMTTELLTDKMNKEALCGKTPEYTKLTEDNKLRTGSEIAINGSTKYIVVVNGDVDGDGEISFLGDVVMANNYRIGQVNLKTIQRLAADVNNNGSIDFISDIVAINNYRLGIIKSL